MNFQRFALLSFAALGLVSTGLLEAREYPRLSSAPYPILKKYIQRTDADRRSRVSCNIYADHVEKVERHSVLARHEIRTGRDVEWRLLALTNATHRCVSTRTPTLNDPSDIVVGYYEAAQRDLRTVTLFTRRAFDREGHFRPSITEDTSVEALWLRRFVDETCALVGY